MPMQRSRYPKNWDAIAMRVKIQANWECQECGRMCKKKSESWNEFVERVVPKAHSLYSYDLLEEICLKPKRFVLTVAHLDHLPENCDYSNLKALCSVCHCRMDLKAMPLKKMLKREYFGQLNLFDT